jgi:hypothetical protein
MKKKIYSIIMLFAIVLSGAGCKKFLDVNKDPNNPPAVQESLILPPVEVTLATNVAAGCYSNLNAVGIAEINSYWIQQLSLNQPIPLIETYKLQPADVVNQWQTLYISIMQNLLSMQDQAEQKGDHSYGVIAKVLTAYTLGVATDMWGDVPYSKAFNGNFTPTYDKQEDIYKTLQNLLDSAIAENALNPGLLVPGGDDYIYGGDMSKWQKLAYTLKARYYLHLTKAPGYNATTQANLALTALQNGFTGFSDEADFNIYDPSAPGHENPWFENISPGQGGVVLASTFIDSELNRVDPRLPFLATLGSGGNDSGRVIGSTPTAPDYTVFSTVGNYIASEGAPLTIVGYSEVQFIKAEATLIVSGFATAQPLYLEALDSSMTKVGLTLSDPSVVAYIATRGPLTSGNALQRIIEEKVIADFLSIENYNDWRRTGFPTLSIVQNPFVPTIPRRYPYSLDEITNNPQPQDTSQITDRVWWDAP